VEALIKPGIGKSRNHFTHRGQTLAVPNAQTRDVLLELYDLRSAVEHQNIPHDVLPGGTEAQRIALVSHRTRQADALARFSLLRVLEADVLFNTFRTDAQIDNFWGFQDHVRVSLWGTRLDIVAIG